ncbi:NAD(P)/FAD-dependent oxidoreductase [Kaistia terrae]|uniref:Thioredoxin reductase n=1 Tax=Kaistia terrae TaxID=537017 RepID=A0ABW0PVW9_9HYPH|nr:NAD(P)/FAD-dependent oxidoreductase [Kaistia terrae]MCX5579613.1 NAD(P)/FAD-dependent oxidoreductase [Kaistia terrae]
MPYDAIIIGGSYAGLSAAMQLARAGRPIAVIDSNTPRNRFADASHGFFGQDGAAPRAMIAQAREKLLAYQNVRFIDGLAIHAHAIPAGFAIDLAEGDTLEASKLVLAFGVVDELPDIPGLAGKWGKSVLHCPYCHGYEFKGQRLGVLNVMEKSVHQALMIPDWGPTTFFLNGGAMPDAETLEKLRRRNVTIEPEKVVSLEGTETDLSGVRLANGRVVGLDAMFTATRPRMASPIAEQLGCAFDEGMLGPVIRIDDMKMTTVPGVYAAGDIARSMHNATFASADGVMAGTALHQALIFEPLAA